MRFEHSLELVGRHPDKRDDAGIVAPWAIARLGRCVAVPQRGAHSRALQPTSREPAALRDHGAECRVLELDDLEVNGLRARDQLARSRLVSLADEHRQKVSLVGWSLGGIFARELAKEAPEKVRQVITLASPFTGHPRATNAFRLYEWMSGHRIGAPDVREPLREPPSVPTTSIWSRTDGIVSWRCSVARAALRREYRDQCEPLRDRGTPARAVCDGRSPGTARRQVATVPASNGSSSRRSRSLARSRWPRPSCTATGYPVTSVWDATDRHDVEERSVRCCPAAAGFRADDRDQTAVVVASRCAPRLRDSWTSAAIAFVVGASPPLVEPRGRLAFAITTMVER